MSMVSDRHLVPVKPELFSAFPCPACGASGVKALASFFPGIQVMGRYTCDGCGTTFLRDLPVGFAVDHPISIDANDGRVIDDAGAPRWLLDQLRGASAAPVTGPVGIERIVHRSCRRVVILDTLDFLYGHVLLKLFNAQHYLDHHPDLGLVLLLPRMYAWLAPKGAAEVWLVDQKLSRANAWYPAIDAFVQERLREYDEVYLGKGYAHPEMDDVQIERFTGQRPFQHEEIPVRPPHVTFIARDDRLWLTARWQRQLYKAMNRVGLRPLARSLFVAQQQRIIRRTMAAIRKQVPGVAFSVVGIGDPGGFAADVQDLRTLTMNSGVELAWCAAYARSAVVVGVHGSNMLLPTAHSAGCVEILPHDRKGNIVQDICVRYRDRMQLFLYRFVDEFAGPDEVARHVMVIFRFYEDYHRDNLVNIFRATGTDRSAAEW